MRSFHPNLIFRNLRKVKFYLGLCSLFCVIVLINGYLTDGFDRVSLISDGLEQEDIDDLTNRRHNRNLQHLYPQEILTKHKKTDLKPKINKHLLNTPQQFVNKSHFSSLNGNSAENEGNEAKDYTHLNFNFKKNDDFSKRLPQAIIIGVKKGGTRALLEFLRAHPDVKATGPEPHFFDKNYEKGLEWYRNLMPESEPTQLTIEKTPGYFITKGVPKRIYNMSASVKLVLVVRDPVTRAISDFAQIATKSSKYHSFESTIFKNNATTVDTSKTLVKIGLYSKHLERWLEYFKRDQIHIVNGENLISDPGKEMIKIQKFLGLPVLITPKHFHFNKSRGFPCIRRKLSKNPHCLDESKGRKHPYINPKSVRSLQDFYKPYNVKFSSMVRQDFEWS